MGKSSPQAPAAPDPNVVSAAQTKSNIDTANANANLNRTNQVTPWGNLTYSKNDTANPDGTFNWTATTQLSPEQQKLLDSSNGISQSMANLGQQQINNVANTVTKPLDFSGLPQVKMNSVAAPSFQSGVQAGAVQSAIPGAGQIQNGYANGGQIQKGIAGAGGIQGDINMGGVGGYTNNVDYGKIQDNVDMSGVPSLVGGDKLYDTMQEAQDAAYKQQSSRLDPQYGQQQHDLENKLVQQGVMQNSDAWNRAMQDFGRTRTDAYQTAYNNSVNNGNAAQAQLYGQGLSSNQNAYGQALNNANFANSAQNQGFSQGMQNANLNNNVTNAQFAQAQAQQAAHNAAQGQQYGQNLSSGQFANSAQAQQDAQNAALAAFGNNAQGQQFGQNAANAAFGNAAQNQVFGQGMQNAGLFNTGQQQNFSNGMMNSQNDYAQSMGARNQGINELLQQQQNPLNILNALRTGSQVTSPTFGQTPQTNIAGTDISGITQNGYNNQMGQYNAQIGQNNALTSGLFGLGAAAIGAPAGGALSRLFG